MLKNLETIDIMASFVVKQCDLVGRHHVSDQNVASIFRDEVWGARNRLVYTRRL
jgi:hypothetical protein